MTDEEVDVQFTVFAVMLATPYFNGDRGELALDIRHDIQAILWRHGYIPAQQMLIEHGATEVQVERARIAKKSLFGIMEGDKPMAPSTKPDP